MGDDVDELKQYSRRNCLLLHGFRELEGKNANDVIMKTVKEEMVIDITGERSGSNTSCWQPKSL